MSFWGEIKRRNVFRVGAAYLLVAWLIVQVANTFFPLLSFPNWTVPLIAVIVILGFPLALLFAWAFELTPEGIKKTEQVPLEESITRITGKKLDYILGGLLLIAVAYILFDNLYLDRRTVHNDAVKTIAVLPFENLSSDPEQEYFVDGLSEELLNWLSNISGLQVTSRTSSFAFKGTDKTLQEVASVLGVNYILEGSVRKSENSLRITAQLIRVEDDSHLWSEIYNRELKDIFNVQEGIATAIANKLKIKLGVGKPFRQLVGTDDVEAYDYYVTALGYLQNYQKSENVQSAVRTLQYALDQDPEFAEAYAAMGQARWLQYIDDKDMQRVEEALAACGRAVELNSNMASGHLCLGDVFTGTGKYEQAVQNFQQALKLEPANDEAYRGLASAYEHLGLYDEAEETYRKAIELRPGYWEGYSSLGVMYLKQGRYNEAEKQFIRVTQLVPDHHFGYSNLGGVYLLEGRYAEAIRVLQHSVELRPTEQALSNLGTACFYRRKFDEALTAYEKAIKLNDKDWMLWGNLGDARYWGPSNQARADEAYRQALALGEQAFQMNARNTRLLGYMAYYHAMLDEKEAARNCMELALATAPQDDPELFFNLAQACYRLGDTDQALEWLKKAKAAGLSNETIQNTPLFDRLSKSQGFQGVLQDDNYLTKEV